MLPAGRPDTNVSIRDQLAGIRQVVKRPEVIVVLIGGTVSFIMIFGVFLSTLPIHLEDQFGYSASMRGLFLAIPAIPSTLVAFNVQRIRTYVDPRPLLVGCSLLFAAGFALIGATEIAGFVVLGCIVYGAGDRGHGGPPRSQTGAGPLPRDVRCVGHRCGVGAELRLPDRRPVGHGCRRRRPHQPRGRPDRRPLEWA
jgi:hypothetical protein